MNLKNLKTEDKALKKKVVKRRTTKAKRPVNEQGMYQVGGSRFMDIATCAKCNGEPPEKPFNLPTMEGIRCGICWEVLGWKKK